MRESIFQKEWLSSWLHHVPFAHVWKIPDAPRSAESRFIPPKPYDCYALVAGRFVAMELKWQKTVSSFPFSSVSDWQLQNLRQVVDNGGSAFIILNIRAAQIPEKTAKRCGLEGRRLNIALPISVQFYDDMDRAHQRASIPFEDLYYNSRIEKIEWDSKTGAWDIPAFLMQAREG